MTQIITDSFSKIINQMAYTLRIDLEGRIIAANPLFLAVTKIQEIPKDLMIYNFEWGQYDKDYYERIISHISQGFIWRDEVKMSYHNVEFWVDMNLALTDDRKYIFLFGLDISERKQNEDVIKTQQQQLFTQSQFSALGEMASGIAHEINNPLAIISGSCSVINQYLKKGEFNKEFIEEMMNDIQETVKRISKIILGLRNLSRDPGKDEFEQVIIPTLLDDVIALCGEKCRGRGIQIRINGFEQLKELPVELLKIQISQVILNLMNNSYDALVSSLEGKEDDINKEKWIDLSAFYLKDSDQVKIIVTDSGTGIPVKVVEKIFNPFFTTKDIGKGTGLGLSLSNAIIKRHQGIFTYNKECPNTQFIITIPRIQNAKKVEGNIESTYNKQ